MGIDVKDWNHWMIYLHMDRSWNGSLVKEPVYWDSTLASAGEVTNLLSNLHARDQDDCH